MKLIIAGGREFNNMALMEKSIKDHFDITDIEIVSGKARGADRLGEIFAAKYDIPVRCFPAQWDFYGKSAGFKRNEQMAEYADQAIVFWDGESKGSKHMIDIMQKIGKKVTVIRY